MGRVQIVREFFGQEIAVDQSTTMQVTCLRCLLTPRMIVDY